MLHRLADGLARASARLVPDAFSIAGLLTLATFVLGVTLGRADVQGCVRAWGGSVWALLPFSMQIAFVMFAGYLLAVAPPAQRLLDFLAAIPRSPRQAVACTALVSMVVCWMNWGVGLIASAMLVPIVARRHPGADYRLLVAAAYLGLGTTWHAGPSGSVPLLAATPGSFMVEDGMIPATIPLAATIFTARNLALVALTIVVFTALAALLHPPPGKTVRASAEALRALRSFAPPDRPSRPTPAERIMFGRWLNASLGMLGLASMVPGMVAGSFSLTLDSVNLLVLSLALVLHPSPASIARAAEEAVRPLHGVVLQFPLYAGIYGIIKDTALASVMAKAFLSVATPRTFPLIVFCYSGVLNYWVPSGGAKWAMEAPYLVRAAGELGVSVRDTMMAYAYGDMSTNLIQPFWAIPLLGVARLEFRDILGYEVLALASYASLVGILLFAGSP